MPYKRIDFPALGRKYRIEATVEVIAVDECDPSCVKLKYENGAKTTNYLKSDRYEWTDFGPVLEDGYYIDDNGELFYRDNTGMPLPGWKVKRGRDRFGDPIPSFPAFPIQKVTLEDKLIYE